MITPVTGLYQLSFNTGLHFSSTKPESNMNCSLYNILSRKNVSGGKYMLQDISGILYVVYYCKQTESWLKTPLNNPETGKANFIPA